MVTKELSFSVLIEKTPEDVFKRLASFLATVELTKSKQKKWAEKFYEELYEGRFVSGGRVLAGAGDLYRIKTLANCFVAKIDKEASMEGRRMSIILSPR